MPRGFTGRIIKLLTVPNEFDVPRRAAAHSVELLPRQLGADDVPTFAEDLLKPSAGRADRHGPKVSVRRVAVAANRVSDDPHEGRLTIIPRTHAPRNTFAG